MIAPSCRSDTAERCGTDSRRALLRTSVTLAGIDYVEVYPDGVTLCVHFFGAAPGPLTREDVVVTGGVRIVDLAVVSVKVHEHDDGDLCLLVKLDKTGDFSTYCLCLVERAPDATAGYASPHCEGEGPPQPPRVSIDPRYACASFSFRLDCPSDADCKPRPCPPPARAPLPPIDYLARDFEGFRRLMLDRLAQTMPHWEERHLPDLGLTLVEQFAYVADQLSYALDAVATEAFLRTARLRISVRRHARLVDYWMHEGCNARAWVTIASTADELDLPLAALAFAALPSDGNRAGGGGLMDWLELRRTPGAIIFEPVCMNEGVTTVDILAAHSQIQFYTWERSECCLPAGSTHATLIDGASAAIGEHVLRLKAGDVLIFEETRGAATGASADADPQHRHVIRLTGATRAIDPRNGTRIWEIEWHRDDALPFDLRLSGRTSAPGCEPIDCAVARGNVLLVDHGVSVDEHDDAWVVGVESDELCCLCDGKAVEQRQVPARLQIQLSRAPLTHAEPAPRGQAAASAAAWTERSPRAALPAVRLYEQASVAKRHPDADADTGTAPGEPADAIPWRAARDLLSSGARDRHFVVETDDEARAHLRFGDGMNGMLPEAGRRFFARTRVGNGPSGHVGADAIVWMALEGRSLSGAALAPRNPLPATGGVAPESTDDVKLYAPHAFGRILERAVAAADYAQLASENPRVQGAFAELAWAGSWYEASVALDAVDRFQGRDTDEVSAQVRARLEVARRIGHDLRLLPARRVALDIALSICVAPHYVRGDVARAARDLLSDRVLPGGALGLFHPDRLTFGRDVTSSPIVAAVQALDGVSHVELTRFARLDTSAADATRSLDDNLIRIHPDELATLSSDPNFPEHGRLVLSVRGGR